MESTLSKPKVLICPLDWGLGHATRCIPIINYLLEKDCIVHIATSGMAYELLHKNFPQLRICSLSPYDIAYSASASKMWQKIMVQIPKITRVIFQEKKEIKLLQAQEHYDIIISDNRYGVAHPTATNIFMTHQVQILSGMHKVIDKFLLSMHHLWMKRYEEIWVVDHPQRQAALAPLLAHPDIELSNKHYIGHLSQLYKSDSFSSKKNIENAHILVLLSGPEPMRTLLEEKITQQATRLTQYQFTIITGSNNNIKAGTPPHITVQTMSSKDEVQSAMASCDLVICRSGYSTVMDLIAVRRAALLIPTPGQTEQEYIASRLDTLGLFYTVSQSSLDLGLDISKALIRRGFLEQNAYEINNGFQSTIDRLLETIQKKKMNKITS